MGTCCSDRYDSLGSSPPGSQQFREPVYSILGVFFEVSVFFDEVSRPAGFVDSCKQHVTGCDIVFCLCHNLKAHERDWLASLS